MSWATGRPSAASAAQRGGSASSVPHSHLRKSASSADQTLRALRAFPQPSFSFSLDRGSGSGLGCCGYPSLPMAESGETFEHYRVLRREDGRLWELGRGATGVTYKAIDTNLDATVALKVINAQALGDDLARERFRREAKSAASLHHPNIASVLYLGGDEANFFYAMEFIDGETVETLLKRAGPLPWIEALQIAHGVASALTAAHGRKLVHRDIQPANIMLVADEEGAARRAVKLIDFSLAKAVAEGSGTHAYTAGSEFLGTPSYASPEQLRNEALDTRSDIYSLGCTLWAMIAGRPPFEGRGDRGARRSSHAAAAFRAPAGRVSRVLARPARCDAGKGTRRAAFHARRAVSSHRALHRNDRRRGRRRCCRRRDGGGNSARDRDDHRSSASRVAVTLPTPRRSTKRTPRRSGRKPRPPPLRPRKPGKKTRRRQTLRRRSRCPAKTSSSPPTDPRLSAPANGRSSSSSPISTNARRGWTRTSARRWRKWKPRRSKSSGQRSPTTARRPMTAGSRCRATARSRWCRKSRAWSSTRRGARSFGKTA